MKAWNISRGSPYLLGANLQSTGCNFSVFSRNCKEVTLHFFSTDSDKVPSASFVLDPIEHRTGDVWHIFIEAVKPGQLYGYTVDGDYTPSVNGNRFNSNKLLIDPYTKAVIGDYFWQDSSLYAYEPGSKLADLSFNKHNDFDKTVKSAVVNCCEFDWEGDRHINIPSSKTIIYEMHVRGLTGDTSSGVKHPGTFLGIIDKIPHLKELGITTVELLPIMEFNEKENIRLNPVTGERLYNFWGYSTLAFFAPNSWYATEYNGVLAVNEFKEMVKALHRAGMEVILDVVYNHTGEGNEYGPTLSFKGLDNRVYYMLEKGRYYKNYSGCGNTVNCNHAVVKRLIIDSLRYWYTDMHVDGFRFDLAAILGRDSKGGWLDDNSVLNEICDDPILRKAKIIAEVWDAAGLYKLGDFPQGWSEWNGKFRDQVRGFIKGDDSLSRDFAMRLIGSPDIFDEEHRKPHNSINFITSHDGFTLKDLVSYNQKHNEENGENNNDGDNHNLSWNCGVEGETDDVEINALRLRQMKNLFAVLLISHGTPMIHHGDEFGFSKGGNNNTYCHNNKLNLLDWNLLDANRGFFEFCKSMISFRKSHPVFTGEEYLSTNIDIIDDDKEKTPDMYFFEPDLSDCKWEWFSKTFSVLLKNPSDKMSEKGQIFIIFNAYWEEMKIKLPELKDANWRLVVNTYSEPSFYENGMVISVQEIVVKSRSIIILES